MTFDEKMQSAVHEHICGNGEPVIDIIASLANQLTVVIQSCILPIEGKLRMAEELTQIMRNQIKEDPHPMARRLH